MSSVDTVAAPTIGITSTARHRGVFARQLRSELRLVFRRRRNLAMLVVLGAIPILIGTAVKVSTPRPGEGGPAFIGQLTNNGLFLAFTALTICLPVFLPLAIAVVCGDAIAGEASTGTLRYLLTVPVSRTRLLLVKSLGALTYVAAAITLVALVGMLTGLALFGSHGVTLLSGDTIPFASGLGRAVGLVIFVFIDLLGLAALAFFLSTLTEVPIGAMAGTVALVIAFAVLDSVPQLGSFRGILLTHHWLDYGDLLRNNYSITSLAHNLLVPISYTAIFGSAAWAKMTSADITS
jgi:ABC-2 type transport system permease protein